MAFSTLRQITKTNTSNKVLEFNDKLQSNNFGEHGVERSTPHNTFSRIEVTIVDFSKGKKENAVVSQYNITPEMAKTIAGLFLSGDYPEFEKPDPALGGVGFVEQKINHYKVDEDGFSPVTKFNIKHQPNMKSPWTISIEVGKGKAERTPIGGVNIKRGTYQKSHDCTMYISKKEMYKMMTTLNDYVKNFEMWSFRAMIEERTKLEIAQREKVAK